MEISLNLIDLIFGLMVAYIISSLMPGEYKEGLGEIKGGLIYIIWAIVWVVVFVIMGFDLLLEAP